MKVEIQQNTPEWHEWRKTCDFTASEAPALFGESKFFPHDAAELKAVKLGLLPPPYYSKAMQDGHKYEERARELAEEELKDIILPACYEKETAGGFKLGASLDGVLDPFTPVNIEIKVSDKPLADLVEQYKWQMQFQMLVSGCETSRLVAYRKETDTVEISEEVKRFMGDDLIDEHIVMYNNTKPAEPKIKDVDDEDTVALADKYLSIDAEIAALKAKQDEIKGKLISKADGRSIRCHGITVYPIKPRKTTNLSQLAKDNGLKPTKEYIKEGAPSWGIRKDKNV